MFMNYLRYRYDHCCDSDTDNSSVRPTLIMSRNRCTRLRRRYSNTSMAHEFLPRSSAICCQPRSSYSRRRPDVSGCGRCSNLRFCFLNRLLPLRFRCRSLCRERECGNENDHDDNIATHDAPEYGPRQARAVFRQGFYFLFRMSTRSVLY